MPITTLIMYKFLVWNDLLEKANKSAIDTEVKNLLALKENFKQATGKVWKPDLQPSNLTQVETMDQCAKNDPKEALMLKVNEQGDLVRKLKGEKAAKVCF